MLNKGFTAMIQILLQGANYTLHDQGSMIRSGLRQTNRWFLVSLVTDGTLDLLLRLFEEICPRINLKYIFLSSYPCFLNKIRRLQQVAGKSILQEGCSEGSAFPFY